jgi:hypothetical protein
MTHRNVGRRVDDGVGGDERERRSDRRHVLRRYARRNMVLLTNRDTSATHSVA